MPPELSQWIPPIVILGFLFNGLESKVGDFQDRMGRIEGTLDVLREFFVGTGQETDRQK